MKPYPKYKDSGIEWLGEVPEGWHITNLRRLSSAISKGTTPSTLGKDMVDEGVRFIKGENIQGGVVVDTPAHFIDIETDEMLSRSRLQAHDVLFVIAGSIGKTAIVKESDAPANTNQAICFIRLSNKNHAKYVHYWLSTDLVQQLVSLDLVQTAQPNVSMDDIGRIPLLLADTAETNAIASFLDRETARIDALIQKKERMIELLKEKRIALITQAVTKGLDANVPMKDSGIEWLGEVPEHWGYCALGRVCRIQGGYAFDSSNFSDEGFPLVQMSNLKRGCLDLTDSKKYPEELCPREVELDEGDILLGMSGSIGDTGSLGNYAMVKKTDLPCYLNQRVGKLDVSSKLYRGFVYYLIQSTPFFEQVQLSVTGTAQFNISPSQLSDIWIALPPATEQNDISNYLDKKTSKMETIIGRVENSITLLREYRASLIHHAVTGKIDLRGHDAQAQ